MRKNKLKIGVVGTRGIPNNYGGFEQFAEYLSVGLVERGHDVSVYSSKQHLYQEKEYKGVHILHQNDPENKFGTVGQFIYDFNCIRDARRRNFDVILNLGYTSSAISMRFFPKKAIIITNMDGLEWKRTKFNKYVQQFLKYSEKLAVKRSDYLVADSLAIQSYIQKKYKVNSKFIAYGAHIFKTPSDEALQEFNVQQHQFSLLIARMEPENNIEIILDGIVKSTYPFPFLVIGNIQNKFGVYLQKKFKSEQRIKFIGPIYDLEKLNNLRFYSDMYFHGHSVGGTNPSLLEAMASSAFIVAHNNDFNKSVLGDDAYYFFNATDVQSILDMKVDKVCEKRFKFNNLNKIDENYEWSFIINEYEKFMLKTINNHSNDRK